MHYLGCTINLAKCNVNGHTSLKETAMWARYTGIDSSTEKIDNLTYDNVGTSQLII